jgi:hypothetical protein
MAHEVIACGANSDSMRVVGLSRLLAIWDDFKYTVGG